MNARVLIIKIYFLIALTAVSLGCHAQVLWEVSGNGLKDKSYILGCNHLLASGSLTGVPGVFHAYNQCERVVSEFEIDEQSAVAAMMSYGKADTMMDELLTLDELAFVDSVMRKDVGLGTQAFMYFKPGIVTAIWIEAVCQSLYPRGEDDEPMDSYFQKMAIIEGKEVRPLERLDDQMSLLLKGSERDQASELVRLMHEGRGKLKVDVEAITKMFNEGDLEGLASVEEREMSETDRHSQVEERNEKWLGTLVEMMRQKRCFVVMRCINMVGNAGMLRALRAKGYIVKAVKE